MCSSWPCESTGLWRSLTGHRVLQHEQQYSDFGLFVVSRRFLAIPVLLELLSRYCAHVTRGVPLLLIVLAAFCFLLQRGGEQTS